MQKLFRFHALSAGQKTQESVKISIQDLAYSRDTTGADPFGSFTVLVRKASDTDNVPEVIERFSNCNLNPLSSNYVGRKIGDKEQYWDSSQRILKTRGNYDNVSQYIRVEMDSTVEQSAIDPRLLPFGVYGPVKYEGTPGMSTSAIGSSTTIIAAGNTGPFGSANVMDVGGLPAATTVQLDFASSAIRHSASAGGMSNPKNAYFGLNASSYMELSASSANRDNRADPGLGDYLYSLGDDFTATADLPSTSKLDAQWVFSLDDLVLSGSSTVFWQENARKNGDAMSTTSSVGWKEPIDQGYTRFTAALYNGFDGLDITAIEPFSNDIIGGKTAQDSYAANSVRRAIDTVADPEFVDMNLISMPGLTDTTLTEHMIQVCEDRGDAMAVIDIPDVYTPFTETESAYK